MIARALVLASGLAGGFGAAQFPEYAQQYVQRLGGAVDALGVVVADFDASAVSSGLTREEALAQMRGTPFLDRRRSDMERTFARHERLQADLALLRAAPPLSRVLHVARMTDADLARATLADFRPAMPLTADAVLLGAIGAGAAIGAAGLIARLGRRLKRRRVEGPSART